MINYVRNAYPNAVTHFQSLDQLIQNLWIDGSFSPHGYTGNISAVDLQFNVPSRVQWIDTLMVMRDATANLIQGMQISTNNS
jgi:hypothetical protein